MIARQIIVDTARRWIGTPFRHQGRNQYGLDCVGLVVVVCRELGISDYDVRGYDRRPTEGASFMQHFTRAGALQLTALDDALPGDLLVLRDNIYPCHVGIVSELHLVPHLLHSTAQHRKVSEDHLKGDLLTRRVAAFRLPGVE